MKKLCSDPDIEVCNSLKALLGAQGIECIVKAEGDQPLLGGERSPLARPMPELWLLDDSLFDEALRLINREAESGLPAPPPDLEPDDA